MKYLIFAGSKYYPNGGAKDLRGFAATHADAMVAALKLDEDWDWLHVYSVETNTIVFEKTKNY